MVIGGNYIRSGGSDGFPKQSQAEFTKDVLDVLGAANSPILFVPDTYQGSKLVCKGAASHILTLEQGLEDFTTTPTKLGQGVAVHIAATDESGCIPDHDDFTFGDGSNDSAVSFFMLFKLSTLGVTHNLFNKWRADNGDDENEYVAFVQSSNKLRILIRDNSEASDNSISVEADDAFVTDTWLFGVITYSGNSSHTGVTMYVNGSSVTIGTGTTGANYVAMENKAAPERIAVGITDAGALTNPLQGSAAIAGIVGKELSASEVFSLTRLVEDFYGLSLT